MKKRILVASFVLLFVFALVFPAQAAGEVLSTTKDQIKANMPIRFTASGLSGSTYYTLYVGTTLKANRSTSATGTTLEFKIVVGDEFVGQYVRVTRNTHHGYISEDDTQRRFAYLGSLMTGYIPDSFTQLPLLILLAEVVCPRLLSGYHWLPQAQLILDV